MKRLIKFLNELIMSLCLIHHGYLCGELLLNAAAHPHTLPKPTIRLVKRSARRESCS